MRRSSTEEAKEEGGNTLPFNGQYISPCSRLGEFGSNSSSKQHVVVSMRWEGIQKTQASAQKGTRVTGRYFGVNLGRTQIK
jgi:hypothetical protein